MLPNVCCGWQRGNSRFRWFRFHLRQVQTGAVFSSIVANFGPFDLDDIGAEIAQDLCATRSCQNARQIEHANSSERAAHRGLVIFSIIQVFLIKFKKFLAAALAHLFYQFLCANPRPVPIGANIVSIEHPSGESVWGSCTDSGSKDRESYRMKVGDSNHLTGARNVRSCRLGQVGQSIRCI